MKKFLLAALLTSVATFPAYAGFLTGVVVGSAISGDGGQVMTKNEDKTEFVYSDRYDVIACRMNAEGNLCLKEIRYRDIRSGWRGRNMTPNEFAGFMGYKLIYKKSVLVTASGAYIVMEVSK